MNEVLKGWIGATIRHALGAIGAIGVVDGASIEQVAAGASAIVVAVGWSFIQKYLAK